MADGTGFRHEVAFYRDPAEYRSAVLPFVRDGLARDEAVLVAVPGPAAAAVRDGLDGRAGAVTYADMTSLGRNPGRVISAIWDFADRHAGTPVRFISELVWPGRSAAEIREAAAHEAMINLAFAACPVTLMCPYDASLLAPRVIASAARAHPFVRTATGARPSADYPPGRARRPRAAALLSPPARAHCLAYSRDLRAVRSFVAEHAAGAGLGADRTTDLVLAAAEMAANTIRHTAAGGTVHIWHTRAEVLCQVSDHGRISDPLAGRRRPPGAGGLGLWVVHQLCDLVELRTGRAGTTIRMHMRLGDPAAAGPAIK
jgi:anti-sigma regulatory factor (Ser/Thr protein kinase)